MRLNSIKLSGFKSFAQPTHFQLPGQLVRVVGANGRTGGLGALVLGRWLTSLAFGISPSDPRILAAAAVLLTMTGLLATWLPSRRAARIEPRVAIQEG